MFKKIETSQTRPGEVRLVEVVGYEADEARISHFYKWERFNNWSVILQGSKRDE
ncbi:MAG TPA: hypothetical protein PKV93_12910 [Fervidobacterium sp.]|nr:hypothetical protein [Fervidobacterium sp.]